MDVVHGTRTFSIESVQRRVARFVTNEYSTTPGNVTKILNDLKRLTLEKRRKVARFTTMFKVVSGLSATQFPPYILFKRRQGTRQFHLKKFIQVGAKTNKYQHSFIARTITEWSSLPSRIIEKQSVELSKRPSCAVFKTLTTRFFFLT